MSRKMNAAEGKPPAVGADDKVVKRGPGRPKKAEKKEASDEEEEYRISIFTIDPVSDVKVQVPVQELANQNTTKLPVKERYMRRRVGAAEREFVWKSTQGYCYLCKTLLPKNSSWHIEHVIAFSKDPSKNDVLGNMLPACATCNLRKNSRDLLTCIDKDLTFDLATFAKDVPHLHTDARNEILMCLNFKHQRLAPHQGKAGDVDLADAYNDETLIHAILNEIEGKLLTLSTGGAANKQDTDGQLFLQIDRNKIFSHAQLDFVEAEAPRIGCGGFGDVYIGNLKLAHNEDVACAIKMQSCLNRTSFKSFLREIEALTKLSHPHIVTSYGWFARSSTTDADKSEELIQKLHDHDEESISNTRLGLVLEYCAYNVSENRVMKNIDLLALCYQTSEALAYIHSQCFVHRDIKPNNILVVKSKNMPWKEVVFKLCDFGLAKYSPPVEAGKTIPLEEHTRNAGTASFRPREVRNGELHFESDIYSLGKTIACILPENDPALANGQLYSYMEGLHERMIINPYTLRPSSSELFQEVSMLRDVLSAKFSEKEYQALVSRHTEARKLKKKNIYAAVEEDAKPKATTTLPQSKKGEDTKLPQDKEAKQSALTITPASPTVDATKMDAKAAGGEEERQVYLTPTACCKEHPKGKKGMKYHTTLTCRYLIGKEEEASRLDESEAKAFLHGLCSTCNASSPNPSPGKKTAATSNAEVNTLGQAISKKLVL